MGNLKSKAPNWMKNAYRKLRKNPLNEKIKDNSAKKCLRNLEKNTVPHTPIKVVFLLQIPEVWDKQETLYDALKQNSNFEVYEIVVPGYDLINSKVKKEYDDTFFLDKYSDAIKALKDNGEWLDLRELGLDFVFYQRPYNNYMPECYMSNEVGKYAKCMYIPYAFWPLREDLCGYTKHFFRYAYKAFMESEEHAIAIQKIHSDPSRIVFCGYPQLSDVKVVDDFDVSKVLWTPRWSYDKRVGGSHFLEYKDSIFELAEECGAQSVVIRPHPLSFDNYIRMGLMTVEEVDAYKKKVEDTPKVSFDANKNIEDTFEDTGVLITDVSSIVFPYFLTGKPIIFCNTDIPLSPAFKALLDGIYVTDSWEEIQEAYKQIVAGNDYLKATRLKIADSIRKANNGAVENIIKVLEEDIGV